MNAMTPLNEQGQSQTNGKRIFTLEQIEQAQTKIDERYQIAFEAGNEAAMQAMIALRVRINAEIETMQYVDPADPSQGLVVTPAPEPAAAPVIAIIKEEVRLKTVHAGDENFTIPAFLRRSEGPASEAQGQTIAKLSPFTTVAKNAAKLSGVKKLITRSMWTKKPPAPKPFYTSDNANSHLNPLPHLARMGAIAGVVGVVYGLAHIPTPYADAQASIAQTNAAPNVRIVPSIVMARADESQNVIRTHYVKSLPVTFDPVTGASKIQEAPKPVVAAAEAPKAITGVAAKGAPDMVAAYGKLRAAMTSGAKSPMDFTAMPTSIGVDNAKVLPLHPLAKGRDLMAAFPLNVAATETAPSDGRIHLRDEAAPAVAAVVPSKTVVAADASAPTPVVREPVKKKVAHRTAPRRYAQVRPHRHRYAALDKTETGRVIKVKYKQAKNETAAPAVPKGEWEGPAVFVAKILNSFVPKPVVATAQPQHQPKVRAANRKPQATIQVAQQPAPHDFFDLLFGPKTPESAMAANAKGRQASRTNFYNGPRG